MRGVYDFASLIAPTRSAHVALPLAHCCHGNIHRHAPALSLDRRLGYALDRYRLAPRCRSSPPFALTERSGQDDHQSRPGREDLGSRFRLHNVPRTLPAHHGGNGEDSGCDCQRSTGANSSRSRSIRRPIRPPSCRSMPIRFAPDANRWWFLTGEQKPLFDLIQNGFLQVRAGQ